MYMKHVACWDLGPVPKICRYIYTQIFRNLKIFLAFFILVFYNCDKATEEDFLEEKKYACFGPWCQRF